jgi:hypothetical protein
MRELGLTDARQRHELDNQYYMMSTIMKCSIRTELELHKMLEGHKIVEQSHVRLSSSHLEMAFLEFHPTWFLCKWIRSRMNAQND